ncbi:MAG: bifunctional (p)ppGpp synthetase/guanosine-3',5'-bis(diphosphate) 3'-pyrophosphohydrolase [Mariprofundaceae bacterium]
MSRIFEIVAKVQAYNPHADIDLIHRAYVFSAHAHAEQKRSSGDPYLVHPLAVANILASLQLDEASIVTALLHDTVEDTHVSLTDIEDRFGLEISQLVDGVTKIGQIAFKTSAHKQAENFRKMLLATAKDLRVLLVKLADRLHNMRTLGFLPKRKRKLISFETLELYAPLAHRLGIHWIKQEMEDLSFQHVEPESYQHISGRLAPQSQSLREICSRLETLLQEALNRQDMHVEVHGRMKHMYSIHQKILHKHVDFDEIYDLIAFRVIVKDIPSCYHTLGVIHSLYRPVPGRFKDYIAIPKPNGYQSLHTSIIGPENYRIEAQIRTESMHRYAEDGIASHWLYKNQGEPLAHQDQQRFMHLKKLRDQFTLLPDTDNPDEFLEHVRLDLFVNEVYVFSRDGDIFALPRGSRPLDFAYAIHTDIGHQCVGIRINGEPADFQSELRNGDQVEIIRDSEQTPSRQWLRYVCTPRARQSINQWFRRQKREAALHIGRQILQESLGTDKKTLGAPLLKALNCDSDHTLMEKLGHGEISVQALFAAAQNINGNLDIASVTKGLMHAAPCCRPLPGDPVFGRFIKDEGMLLHHRDCSELAVDTNDWLVVHWNGEEDKLYPTAIELRTRNLRGMLANVSGCISACHANIEDLRLRQHSGSITTFYILIEVESRKHLADIMRILKTLDDVVAVGRSSESGLLASERKQNLGLRDKIRSIMFRSKK